jgi:hypothetical protein
MYTSLTGIADEGELDGRGNEDPELGNVTGAMPIMVRLVDGGGVEWATDAEGYTAAELVMTGPCEAATWDTTRAGGGIVATTAGITIGGEGATDGGGAMGGGPADTPRGAIGGGATDDTRGAAMGAIGAEGGTETGPRAGGAVEIAPRVGGGADNLAERAAIGIDALDRSSSEPKSKSSSSSPGGSVGGIIGISCAATSKRMPQNLQRTANAGTC